VGTTASITVVCPREEVERLWRDPEFRSSYIEDADSTVRFAEAPGDRGAEMHR